jgi:translation initiation factor IF-3
MRKQDERFLVRKNEQIRVPRVLLVKEGAKIGIFDTRDALRMARNEGLDLVEIVPTARPPVCSITDYGQYKYEETKKKKAQRHTGPKEKEVSFRYVIDPHDLQVKVNQMQRILEEGDKVKIMVRFKARENAHKDQGMVTIQKCLELVSSFAVVEKQPSFEGNTIVCRLAPKTKN